MAGYHQHTMGVASSWGWGIHSGLPGALHMLLGGSGLSVLSMEGSLVAAALLQLGLCNKHSPLLLRSASAVHSTQMIKSLKPGSAGLPAHQVKSITYQLLQVGVIPPVATWLHSLRAGQTRLCFGTSSLSPCGLLETIRAPLAEIAGVSCAQHDPVGGCGSGGYGSWAVTGDMLDVAQPRSH